VEIIRPLYRHLFPDFLQSRIYYLRHPEARLHARLSKVGRGAIEKFLEALAAQDIIRGRVLEIGAGEREQNQTRFSRPGVFYIRSELALNTESDVNLVCDGTRLPIASTALGAIILSEVLEHVPRFEQMLQECARALRPGGYLILTVPFFYPYHGLDRDTGDYWRFGAPGLKHLLRKDFTLVRESDAHLFYEGDDYPVNTQMLWQRTVT
jgi:SAM-dependent methyltransferase